ncbi:MAG: SSU ribosomal protein S10p (S20e), partial [uncultured Acetobacteraceae bacterium]
GLPEPDHPNSPQGVRLSRAGCQHCRDRVDRQAHRRKCPRPHPASEQDREVHGAARPPHRQEVPRPVRDPHAQAAPGYRGPHAPDGGRAHEARPRRRRGRRDQDL